MYSYFRFLFLIACFFPVFHLPAYSDPPVVEGKKSPNEDRPARTDRYGDLLPDGALVRLGTMRLRGRDSLLAFSPDSKQLLSGGLDEGLFQFWDIQTGKAVRQLSVKGVTGGLSCFGVSADGSLLAMGGTSGTFLWDVVTGQRRGNFKVPRPLALAFSPDGKVLASGGEGGAVHLWDVTTGNEKRQLARHAGNVGTVLFTPDGNTLITTDRGALRLWDASTGQEIRTIKGEQHDAESVAVSPDGLILASGGSRRVGNARQGRLALWDVATGRLLRELGGHAEKLEGIAFCPVAFSPDGKTLASAWAESLCLWDVATGKELRRIGDQRWRLSRLVFSPDGKTLAAAGTVPVILLWDVATGKPLHQFTGHEGPVSSVAFSPDGQWVVTGGAGRAGAGDHSVRLWNAATGEQLRLLRGHDSWIAKVMFTPDGTGIVSGSLDGTLRLWNVRSGNEVRKYQVREQRGRFDDQVQEFALSSDGQKLISVSNDGPENRLARTQTTWDMATGKQLAKHPLTSLADDPLRVEIQGLRPPTLSAGAEILADPTGAAIFLRKTATTRQFLALQPPADPKEVERLLTTMAFAPDGRTLAARTDISLRTGEGTVALSGCAIRLWELATGKPILRIPLGRNYFGSLAFSPDGRTLAAASYQGMVGLWDVATGKELLTHRGPRFAQAIALSPDGRRLAVGYRDSTVLIWDMAPGAEPAGRPPKDLPAEGLDRLVADLASEDAGQAHAAIWTLVSRPEQTVPHLKKVLRPARGISVKEVEKLIADLDNNQFAVREKAAADLKSIGEQAEPTLHKALEGRPSLELRRRVEAILEGIERRSLTTEQLHVLRAVQVLEHVGTPDAWRLLESLAKGAPEARLTREAKASLERLARPAITP